MEEIYLLIIFLITLFLMKKYLEFCFKSIDNLLERNKK